MTIAQLKSPVLLDNSHQQSVVKYAMEKCSIQLENTINQLQALLDQRAECETGIRDAKHYKNSQAYIREYQLLILHLEKDIEIHKRQVAINQQKLEQYQYRLQSMRGETQLNEMKAAIKSLEQRQHELFSSEVTQLSAASYAPDHVLLIPQHPHQCTPDRGMGDVKK